MPPAELWEVAVTGWVLAMRNLKLEREQTPEGMTCLEVERASQRRCH